MSVEIDPKRVLTQAIRDYMQTVNRDAYCAEYVLVAGLIPVTEGDETVLHVVPEDDTPFWRVKGLLQIAAEMEPGGHCHEQM